jgi:putative N6-adenine-specific DNA methylase
MRNFGDSFTMKLIAKTLYGLETVLAEELTELGASDVTPVNRAVLFSGNKDLLYKVNYASRTALSVLVALSGFRIKSREDLYRKCHEIKWSDFMDNYSTFSVVPVVNSDIFPHSGYPALVVKDAIADYFREKSGQRPSVDLKNPDIVINLHVSNDHADISLDSSVIPLFKRGYREEQGLAPLNEVLAAGMLKLSGWDGKMPLHDPMCGSGTIVIEAAMMAAGIPAGNCRKHFGFMKWNNYDEELFSRIRKEMMPENLPDISITGSDISDEAIRQAANNLVRAGVEKLVSLETASFSDVKVNEGKGYLVFNPPYGERLKTDDPEKLYSMIGTTLKHRYPGKSAWIITSAKEYLRFVGLKPVRKYTLYNGSLECVYAGYELYEGSRKHSAVDIINKDVNHNK